LGKRFPEDFGTREDLCLLLDGLRDRFDVSVVDIDCDEDGLRIETVFLLTEKIRGDEGWVGGLVADDLCVVT